MKRGAPTRFGVRLSIFFLVLAAVSLLSFLAKWGTGEEVQHFWATFIDLFVAFFEMVTPG